LAVIKSRTNVKTPRYCNLNINVFKERLQELEQDYSQAKIDQETFNALKIELERQLLSLAQEHQHKFRRGINSLKG
jgi:cytochrome c-type biogenesis protein CcmI